MSQTKTGQNLRWYFGGSPVGMGRVTSLKPDTSRGLDPVKQAGNDDVVEYAAKIKETTVAFGYNVISKRQLADAMNTTSTGVPILSSGAVAVPDIPENFDCVEKRIKAGTANTGHYGSSSVWVSDEVIEGFTFYQLVAWEKDTYEQEVDKIVARSLSAKCKRPLDFEGINGIYFDRFRGNGVRNTFQLTQAATVPLASGQRVIRVEAPLMNYLVEGVDYTITLPNDPGLGGGLIISMTSSGVSPFNTAATATSATNPGQNGDNTGWASTFSNGVFTGGFGKQGGGGSGVTPVLTFNVPPPSSAVGNFNILCVYAW